MDRRKLIAGSLLAAAASLAVRAVAKSEPAPTGPSQFMVLTPEECRQIREAQQKLVDYLKPGIWATFPSSDNLYAWVNNAAPGNIIIRAGMTGWPRYHTLHIKCDDIQNFDTKAYGEALLKLKHAVLQERGRAFTNNEDGECILL